MRRTLAGTIMLLSVGGCATRLPPPATPAAPKPVVVTARPVLPDGMPERLAVPPVDAEGRYRTVNYGLSEDQRIWNVRSALNVAVLSCRGPAEAAMAADYNALLARQKAVLAKAYAGVQTQSRAAGGADWQTAQDAQATRIYNFFALPPAKPGFCAVATALLTEARTVETAAFPAFAATALPRLEAPFLDVYRAYDGYRHALAVWEAGQKPVAPLTAVAASAPRLDYVGVERLLDWSPAGSKPELTWRP